MTLFVNCFSSPCASFTFQGCWFIQFRVTASTASRLFLFTFTQFFFLFYIWSIQHFVSLSAKKKCKRQSGRQISRPHSKGSRKNGNSIKINRTSSKRGKLRSNWEVSIGGESKLNKRSHKTAKTQNHVGNYWIKFPKWESYKLKNFVLRQKSTYVINKWK